MGDTDSYSVLSGSTNWFVGVDNVLLSSMMIAINQSAPAWTICSYRVSPRVCLRGWSHLPSPCSSTRCCALMISKVMNSTTSALFYSEIYNILGDFGFWGQWKAPVSMKVGKGFTQPIVVDDPEEEASSNCGRSWKYQRYDGIYI